MALSMRIFKNKAFFQWAKHEKLKDAALIKAVEEMEDGLWEASLGGGVYKKRIPIPGQGKRSSLRTIIAYKINNVAIFVYGFAKNNKANISAKEQKALKLLAKLYLGYNEKELEKAIKIGEFIEVKL